MLSDDESDREVMQRFAPLSRSIQDFIAEFLGESAAVTCAISFVARATRAVSRCVIQVFIAQSLFANAAGARTILPTWQHSRRSGCAGLSLCVHKKPAAKSLHRCNLANC